MEQPYKHVEFPRVVYGPDDKSEVINSEDDRPEGYSNTPGGFTSGVNTEAVEKEEAKKEEIRAFLDKHSVEYSPRLGIAKLEALSTELVEHLTAAKAAEEAAEDTIEGGVEDDNSS